MLLTAAKEGVGIRPALVTSFALARVLAGFLFGVAPRDPAVFIGVPIVLGLVAFKAVWLPARRASRLEPMVALRHD